MLIMDSYATLTRGVLLCLIQLTLGGCAEQDPETPHLHWYVFDERSGAFDQAARYCTEASQGRYQIEMAPLPSSADQQREQLVRRLAAGDSAIDIIGMDVIWTAEFAEAGWILPWREEHARQARTGKLVECDRKLELPTTAVGDAVHHQHPAPVVSHRPRGRASRDLG